MNQIEKRFIRVFVGLGETEPTLEEMKTLISSARFRPDVPCLFTDKRRGFVPVKEVEYLIDFSNE
jgi:hypothetical protein